MNQESETYLYPPSLGGAEPIVAVVFVDRAEHCQVASMKGQTIQATHLDKKAALDLGKRLVKWAQPLYFSTRDKWEETGRQATKEARRLQAENADLEMQLGMAATELRETRAKLANALDRCAVLGKDYVELRKVAEHNERVMDELETKLRQVAKLQGVELPVPPAPAKPLAYILPPSKETGNANFLLFTYADGKCVFDATYQSVVECEAIRRGYEILAPWDARHPLNPGPVPAYPQPEEGSSDTAPARPFMAPPSQSPQQRDGNVLRIKEHRSWGRSSWCLHRPDESQMSTPFPSLEQAIQWCKRYDFDYRY